MEECDWETELDPEGKSWIRKDGPVAVEIKPRLRVDVQSLLELIEDEMPPLRLIRCRRVSHVYYGFGDASGSAFGATLSDGHHTQFEYGQWSTPDSEQSSN